MYFSVVVIPDRALVLDWVFADGPPKHAIAYDNNHRQDFHAIVPKHIPEELYWVEEELQIFKALQEERRLREEAMRAKVGCNIPLKVKASEVDLMGQIWKSSLLNSIAYLSCMFPSIVL